MLLNIASYELCDPNVAAEIEVFRHRMRGEGNGVHVTRCRNLSSGALVSLHRRGVIKQPLESPSACIAGISFLTEIFLTGLLTNFVRGVTFQLFALEVLRQNATAQFGPVRLIQRPLHVTPISAL